MGSTPSPSGLRDGNYSIAVTQGLVEHLNDAELEAVLGHELTHIRNRDTQLLVVALIFAGIFSFVGQLVFNNWGFPLGFGSGRRSSSDSDSDRKSSGGGAAIAIIIAIVIIAISWGLAVLIRFALSRRREYLADSGSVELTKNPDALISALRKIAVAPQVPQASTHMSAFFIESPAMVPERSWFSTHPSIQSRVERWSALPAGMTCRRLHFCRRRLSSRSFCRAVPTWHPRVPGDAQGAMGHLRPSFYAFSARISA